jgi:SAM-dependent methyltransferase
MGDVNQLLYAADRLGRIDGAVLEIGSKDYGSTAPFRRELDFTGEYVGLDLQPGPGVDLVGDLSLGLCGLRHESFALIICCSVLEHVKKPWEMAANIERLIRPDGNVYIAVPWVWRYHGYPKDYYRFSHSGIQELFPRLEWREVCFATEVPGAFLPIRSDEEAQQICDRLMGVGKSSGPPQKFLPYLQVLMLGCRRS